MTQPPSPGLAALGAFVAEVRNAVGRGAYTDWDGIVALYLEVPDTFREDARGVAGAVLGQDAVYRLDTATTAAQDLESAIQTPEPLTPVCGHCRGGREAGIYCERCGVSLCQGCSTEPCPLGHP